MPRPTYYMTPTARRHLKAAVHDTHRRWGKQQAKRYNAAFLAGLQALADNHATLHTPHRAALAENTDFSLHLVEQRYVAFQVDEKNTVIVAGIFHGAMDIPAQLRILQSLTPHEIDTLKQEIAARPSL